MVHRFPRRFALGAPILKPNAATEAESKKSRWASLGGIRKNNVNFAAERQCPHRVEAREREPSGVPIYRLLVLEREIRSGLEEPPDMIS